MPQDSLPHYTRVAIVQLPCDLVEQHVPASVQNLELAIETADPRARQLLTDLQEKLDELHLEVWRLAEAQAFSHVESVLSFCGKARRQVDIVIFPDVLPYSWLDRIDDLCGKLEIPAVIAGPHVIRKTPDMHLGDCIRTHIFIKSPSWRREVVVRVRDYPVLLWVRRWNELFWALAPPPRGSARTLVAVPSAPVGGGDALQLAPRISQLQRRFGVAIALANAGGYSRFFARSENPSVNENASDEFPISSLLYRVPPEDSAVTISDIDLLQQRQALPETSEPPFRTVTVAPLIPEDDFPEYSRYLHDMRASGGGAEQWVLSQRAGWVRRHTLRRLTGERRLRYKTFHMKLTEVENSCGPAGDFSVLYRHADPSDIERLVDAVVLPSRVNSIWWLLESIRLTLGQLAERLPPRDSLLVRSIDERIDSLWAHYTHTEELAQNSAAPRLEIPRERRIDLLLLATALIQIQLESKEFSRAGNDFAMGDDLWDSIDAIFDSLKDSFEISPVSMNQLRRFVVQGPHRESPLGISSRGASIFGIGAKQQIAEVLDATLKADKSEEADFGRLLDTISESGVEVKVLQAITGIGPELTAMKRRLRLQRALARDNGGLRSLYVPFLPQFELALLTRDLVGMRGLAVYLVCQDDPEEVLRGLLLELEVLYRILRLFHPEKLRELARLAPQQRRSRLAARRKQIQRDGPLLVAALERLLSEPQQHWQEVPQIFRRMRSLLQAKQEISILTLLGMLPE